MEEEKDIWLGLDISTSCIGCALVENDGSLYGKVLELTHVLPKVSSKTDKMEALFLKKEIFEEEFISKYKHFNVSHVVIESPLLKSNNAVTCSVLLMFNGMISECVYRAFGIVPEYVSSYEARQYSFPKLMGIRKFGKDDNPYPPKKIENEVRKSNFSLFGSYHWSIDKKNIIQQCVAEVFPDIRWLYDKNGELKKVNFDACDAYVAVLAQINKKRYGKLEMTSSNIAENEDESGKYLTFDVEYWDRKETRKIYLN